MTPSVAELERLLANGHGRAVLLLHGRDPSPYRAAILHAAVHNLAYDRQLEDGRGTYLFDVIEATGDVESFLALVVQALLEATDDWDADQLFNLAVRFAQAGHGAAREAIYTRFDRQNTREPFRGAGALVDLDGLDGLLHVAELVGPTLPSPPDPPEELPGQIVAEERFGAEVVRAALEGAAEGRPGVAAYLRALDADRQWWAERPPGPRPRKEASSYEELRAAIIAHGSRRLGPSIPSSWGSKADDAQLAQAAADLLAETDEDCLVAYLWIFRKRRFPLDPAPLFPLVRSHNGRLSAAAFNALAVIADPRIRALALDVLVDGALTGYQRGRAADLLEHNAAPGDAAMLASLLAERTDRDELHALGFGLLDLLAAHPSPDDASALLALYEYEPCAHCREGGVERLHGLGELPSWLAEECRYDVNPELRASVETWSAVP